MTEEDWNGTAHTKLSDLLMMLRHKFRASLQAFVVTLGRAGEDNKSFRLTDTDTTFQGFVGADYDLQVTISQQIRLCLTRNNSNP